MNILSLFDGISCGRIAFDVAEIKVDNYYSSEIDKNTITMSNKNYPDIIRLGSITDILEEELKKLPKIDVIIGGSPCQGFSRQGRGLNFEDPRSKLFFEFIRILKWIREENNPNVKFLLENVHMKKEWENIITEYIGVSPIDINSKLLSAQNRPRMYWTDIEFEDIEDEGILLLDILEDVDTSNFYTYKGLRVDPSIKDESVGLIDVVDGVVRVKQATKQGYIIANNGDGINLSFPTSKSRRGRVISQKHLH